eukprot:COSAG03_NODE_804_length_5790_cov_54.606923_5_plen_204_part_00
MQKNAGKRIVTVEGGYSANTPLSVTHQAHFADPNRGKIGGGATKPAPKAGPSVRSDMPVSDGRAHAVALGEQGGVSAEAATALSASAPAAAAPAAAPATTQQGTSPEKAAGNGAVATQQPAAQQHLQSDAPAEIVTEVIPAPSISVPRLIGKGGSTIKVCNFHRSFLAITVPLSLPLSLSLSSSRTRALELATLLNWCVGDRR